MDINDLIKSRLQELPSNVEPINSLNSKNGFSIPKLNLPVFGGIATLTLNKDKPSSLELSLQKIKDAAAVKGAPNTVDQQITEKLQGLVINPDTKSIDLTSALNARDAVKPSCRRNHKPKDEDPDLDPFEKSIVIEFCEPDISKFRYGQFCCEPSSFGKFTCIRYRRYSAKRITIDHGFHPKHCIARFNFTTKSPDDIVSSKNSKIKLN